MEDNKQQMPQFNGWKDAKIDGNMPIEGLIQFLNILNQRLILIEDQLTIKVGNEGNSQNITLTQYWIEVQKQEYQKMMEEMQKQMEAQEKAKEQSNSQSENQSNVQ